MNLYDVFYSHQTMAIMCINDGEMYKTLPRVGIKDDFITEVEKVFQAYQKTLNVEYVDATLFLEQIASQKIYDCDRFKTGFSHKRLEYIIRNELEMFIYGIARPNMYDDDYDDIFYGVNHSFKLKEYKTMGIPYPKSFFRAKRMVLTLDEYDSFHNAECKNLELIGNRDIMVIDTNKIKTLGICLSCDVEYVKIINNSDLASLDINNRGIKTIETSNNCDLVLTISKGIDNIKIKNVKPSVILNYSKVNIDCELSDVVWYSGKNDDVLSRMPHLKYFSDLNCWLDE